MSRKITFLTLFLWLMTLTFPVIAQQKADTTYTFRFVTQKDMFYVPWNGNDTELARLLECIENNKATILDGKLPLLVDGYCNSQSSETCSTFCPSWVKTARSLVPITLPVPVTSCVIT